MGLEIESSPESKAGPNGVNPPSGDYQRLETRVASIEEKVDGLNGKLDQLLAVVPTPSEKRAVLAMGGVVAVILGALAKRYLGIEIPLSDTELVAGTVGAVTLASGVMGLRKRGKAPR